MHAVKRQSIDIKGQALKREEKKKEAVLIM